MTKEQQNCKYCHETTSEVDELIPHCLPLISNDKQNLQIYLNDPIRIDCSFMTNVEGKAAHQQINFCPMCGRKLSN